MKQNFQYFDIITTLFVVVLLISNVVSAKIVDLWFFTFDAGTLLFPMSYIFGDILTEVYGYRRSRKVIWIGFFSCILMSLIFIGVGKIPPAEGWKYQSDYENILGLTPRIVLASLVAYFCGEFANSVTLAKLKIFTRGRFLWTRTISSTIIGEGVDTFLFVFIAFSGILPKGIITSVMLSNYIFKVGFEVLATPLTYVICRFLKNKEMIDVYDYGTNFSPFRLEVSYG